MKKYSRKREAILECVRSADNHPTADWIYNRLKPQFPDLSLATVYRNLAIFKEEGLISSAGIINGQERFDGIVGPHPHFICQICGAVIDLDLPWSIGSLERQAEEVTGGVVTGYRISLTGRCPACLKKQAAPAASPPDAAE